MRKPEVQSVLVIDDKPDNLITMKAVIKDALPDCEIFTALSGSEGLDMAELHDPDVILLDILMPGIDGYEVCRKIKASSDTNHIPVVFLTALKHDRESRIKAMEVGGDGFLGKPVDASELLAQLRVMKKLKTATIETRNQQAKLQGKVDAQTQALKEQNEATLNLLEDLYQENELRKQSEEALRQSEKQYAFLAEAAFELAKLISIKDIYIYASQKLWSLFDENGYVALVEFDLSINHWKMEHVVGLGKNFTALTKLLGFSITEMEGEISHKYHNKLIDGKVSELEFDFPGLFNNRLSKQTGNAIRRLFSVEKLYSIALHIDYMMAANITFAVRKGSPPVNFGLVESFVQYVTVFLRRQRAEDVLKLSEIKYATLFETSNDALLLMDAGTVIDCNRKALEMFSCNREDLVGQHPGSFSPKEQPNGELSNLLATAKINEAIEGGYQFFEWQHKRFDGSLFDTEVSLNTFHLGDQLLLQAIVRDITDRKASRIALIASEEKMRSIYQVAPVGIGMVANRVLMEVNPRVCELTGYSQEELVGRDALILYPSKDEYDQVGQEKYRQIMEHGVGTVETKWKTREGDVVDILLTFTPVSRKDFSKGVIFTAMDITERNKALKVQQIQYMIARSILESQSLRETLMFIKEQLNNVFDATNFLVAIYHQKEDELEQLFFEDEKDNYVRWPARRSMSGQVVKLKRTILMKREEIIAFAQKEQLDLMGTMAECWLGVPISLGGEIGGVIVIQSYQDPDAFQPTDIALMEMIAHELGVFLEKHQMFEELVVAKEKAEAGDRLKSTFMNNISHEIRTPLNGIMGAVQLLSNSGLSYDERREYEKILNHSSNRLMNTITDYMDVSMIVSGVLETHKKSVPANVLMRDMYQKFAGQFQDKGLSLHLKVPGNISVKLITDAELLKKCLSHLLNNAFKFTPSGSVVLGYEVTDDTVLFRVQDTGVGIAPEKIQEIFQAFGQEETGYNRGHEGTGLGLTIVKGIMDLLGGKVEVVSEKGQGSEFILKLPYHIEEDETHHASHGNGSASKPEPENGSAVTDDSVDENVDGFLEPMVLVVEDDESNAMYIRAVVEATGCHSLLAHNGAEAVEICKANQDISCVLMDIKMPVMDGVEAASLIRKFRPNLPIIALTAHAVTGDETKMLNAGFNAYQTKPIRLDVLNELLRRYAGLEAK